MKTLRKDKVIRSIHGSSEKIRPSSTQETEVLYQKVLKGKTK